MIPKRITVHCSATKNNERLDIKVIRKWHVEDNGWKDVGYHVVIQPDGEIQKGRGLNVQGAHVSGHNKENIGICLIGDTRFTLRQFDALRYQLEGLQQLYDIRTWDIHCHYEFDSAQKQGKTCPNIRAVDLMSWYILEDERAIRPYLVNESEWGF